MMRRSLLLLFLLLTTACGPAEPNPISEQTPENTALQLGEAVYADNCASCHGVNLEGQPDWQAPNPDGTWKSPPHDDTGHTWHHPDAYIRDRIVNGTDGLDAQMKQNSNMPAYSDVLSDAEIDAVMQFIKSRWSSEIQTMQSQRNN